MKHNAETKLRPCPFCGSDKNGALNGPQMSIGLIYCPGCGATVSFQGKERMADAISSYNARAEVKK